MSATIELMQLLRTITPTDISPDKPTGDREAYKPRPAARAVVFDESQQVALMHVSKHGYYKLPGGGVEAGEEPAQALEREVLEELGCKAQVVREVGTIVTYFLERWHEAQTDTCYIVLKAGSSTTPSLTDFEIGEGQEAVWASTIEEAIQLVRSATPKAMDGKLIQQRDLTFLEEAAKLTSSTRL